MKARLCLKTATIKFFISLERSGSTGRGNKLSSVKNSSEKIFKYKVVFYHISMYCRIKFSPMQKRLFFQIKLILYEKCISG